MPSPSSPVDLGLNREVVILESDAQSGGPPRAGVGFGPFTVPPETARGLSLEDLVRNRRLIHEAGAEFLQGQVVAATVQGADSGRVLPEIAPKEYAEYSLLAGGMLELEDGRRVTIGSVADGLGDPPRTGAPEKTIAERRQIQEERDRRYQSACDHWAQKALVGDWDSVVADPEVYRYAGQVFERDPRRNDDYRNQVLKGLGYDKVEAKGDLS